MSHAKAIAMDTVAKTIRICLGSSCYSRGNAENLDIIRTYVASHAIAYKIEFYGQLCSENCNRGPVIEIEQKVFEEVSQSSLMKILADNLLTMKP